MKLLTFEYEGRAVPGVLSQEMESVYPLSAFGIRAMIHGKTEQPRSFRLFT